MVERLPACLTRDSALPKNETSRIGIYNTIITHKKSHDTSRFGILVVDTKECRRAENKRGGKRSNVDFVRIKPRKYRFYDLNISDLWDSVRKGRKPLDMKTGIYEFVMCIKLIKVETTISNILC